VRGLSPHGGRYCRGTEHLDSRLSQCSRALSEAAARCHEVVDDNYGRIRPDRSPQSERASQILLAGSRTEPRLISDFPSLSKRRSHRCWISRLEAAGGESGHCMRSVEASLPDGSNC
jgi:hypothetical protein